jgi:AI-2 transport protein TqsA
MVAIPKQQVERRVQTICLLILTLIAVGGALSLLQPMLVPFLLALLFSYVLTPVVDWQMRWLRLPRTLALIGTGIFGLLVLGILGFLVALSVSKVGQHLDEYEAHLSQFSDRVTEAMPLEHLGIHPDRDTGRFFTIAENTTRQLLVSVLSGITGLISNGALVVIFLIFILFGSKETPRTSPGLLVEIETRTRRYILLMVFLSILSGLLVWLTLGLLGVEFAFVFGFLAFLLNFIPSIGGIIATLLPLPVILVSPEMSITAKLLALVIPAIVQFLLGNLVQPRLLGHSLDLHPVALLMALIFFGMIWGIVGAFLAAPLTGVIKIVFARLPDTRPLAEVLAGNLDALAQLGERKTASQSEAKE